MFWPTIGIGRLVVGRSAAGSRTCTCPAIRQVAIVKAHYLSYIVFYFTPVCFACWTHRRHVVGKTETKTNIGIQQACQRWSYCDCGAKIIVVHRYYWLGFVGVIEIPIPIPVDECKQFCGAACRVHQANRNIGGYASDKHWQRDAIFVISSGAWIRVMVVIGSSQGIGLTKSFRIYRVTQFQGYVAGGIRQNLVAWAVVSRSIGVVGHVVPSSSTRATIGQVAPIVAHYAYQVIFYFPIGCKSRWAHRSLCSQAQTHPQILVQYCIFRYADRHTGAPHIAKRS